LGTKKATDDSVVVGQKAKIRYGPPLPLDTPVPHNGAMKTSADTLIHREALARASRVCPCGSSADASPGTFVDLGLYSDSGTLMAKAPRSQFVCQDDAGKYEPRELRRHRLSLARVLAGAE
jgi:hypothetical protein